MKKRLLLYITIISILLNLCAIGIFATGQQEYVTAILNREVKMIWNGEEYFPLDNSSGERLYPITYNGRTYVPVRAIAEQTGMSVDWDAQNRSVLFGANFNAETGMRYPDSTYIPPDPYQFH